jgi:hypothetical protein
MSSQALAAIIAFAAGVLVTTLSGWFSQRLERRKHLAQMASVAFADMCDAVCANGACEAAFASLGGRISEDEKRYWHRRIYETRAEAFSAKARLGAFGSSELNRFFAKIERRGGITDNDPDTRKLTAKMVLSFREQLGFKKNDISERDLEVVLFGPMFAEGEGPPIVGLRGYAPPSFNGRRRHGAREPRVRRIMRGFRSSTRKRRILGQARDSTP